MSKERQETRRADLLALKRCFDEEPTDAEVRATRDRLAAEFLQAQDWAVHGGMVVDSSGKNVQLVPVVEKARNIVALALQYWEEKD